MEKLRGRGAVFVESVQDVPEGATVVFSAHGVAPSVHAKAGRRSLGRSRPSSRIPQGGSGWASVP